MEVNKISSDTQKSMKTRTITGLVMAAIGLPCLILGDWFFIILMVLIAGVAIYETLKVTGKKYPWYVWAITYIFTYSFIFWVFFQRDSSLQMTSAFYDSTVHHFYMLDIRISTMGIALMIALLFGTSIITEKIDIHDVFFIFSMSVFLGIAFQSILFLRFCPQALAAEEFNYTSQYATCFLFLYVLMGVCFNDIFAYFTGILFGKHKMCPKVSPKKTWEGFFGGIICSGAATVGFALICDLCFHTPILKGIIDAEHWYYAAVISILVAFSAVLGDLMFSLIKRCFSIKDFGNIFPGHGGVLDRFDSLLISAFLASVLIAYIYYQPILGAIGK